MRTPPRDVLLSHAASRIGRGWAFGIHEALDQMDAVAEPLLVAAVLYRRARYVLGFAPLGRGFDGLFRSGQRSSV